MFPYVIRPSVSWVKQKMLLLSPPTIQQIIQMLAILDEEQVVKTEDHETKYHVESYSGHSIANV